MKHITIFILLLLMACEEALKVPQEVYDNPLDIEHITEEGIETPALLFFPDEININTNEIFTVSVYALGVQNVAGAYININYDERFPTTSYEARGIGSLCRGAYFHSPCFNEWSY